MITTKRQRCARFVWAYVTRYSGVSARQIAGAQGDYTRAEVNQALIDLKAGGLVDRCGNGGGMYSKWRALVPFVVDGRGLGV